MPAMRHLRPLALVVALLANACTLVVLDDALTAPSPCAQAGDCAAGFACSNGACLAVEPATIPPPEGTLIGPAGGELRGPDGVLLTVPAGAFTDDTELTLERESSTNVARGCEQHSAFYRVTPGVELAVAATLSIPVVDCDSCVVCAAPSGADEDWLPLDEPAVTPAGSASALVSDTGAVVVAGVAP